VFYPGVLFLLPAVCGLGGGRFGAAVLGVDAGVCMRFCQLYMLASILFRLRVFSVGLWLAFCRFAVGLLLVFSWRCSSDSSDAATVVGAEAAGCPHQVQGLLLCFLGGFLRGFCLSRCFCGNRFPFVFIYFFHPSLLVHLARACWLIIFCHLKKKINKFTVAHKNQLSTKKRCVFGSPFHKKSTVKRD